MEVFDSLGEFLGYKNIVNENVKNIHMWLKQKEKIENMEILGYIDTPTPDFQGSPSVAIINNKNSSKRHSVYFAITSSNILFGSVFFSIRHCIKATWQNDRDQFYAPYDDAFQDDSEFKNNCLIFMLFHSKNRIMSTQGTSHFIPFDEEEVGAKERYDSHALLDFLKGKIKEEGDSLFLNAKENKPLEFSPYASKVFDAGREIYRHYHKQASTNRLYNTNASLYDIKEFFQGRNAQGKLNLPAKAKDEHYKQLYANLQDALKDLAKEIQPKVYEYGFLRE
ncbi:nucleoside 5-triphosphatase RdgB (dHAPTP, dITP,XTP-specific) [Helicobacter pylori]|nr:nucleoside 5-triphosphatase RdgB (dHAPTP, dITP,XTP-specific) [Helicobacter pylori]